MNIRRKLDTEMLSWEIKENQGLVRSAMEKAEVMTMLQGKLPAYVEQIADVIAATRPLQLPMTWTLYENLLWKPEAEGGRCLPVVTISNTHVAWDAREYKTGRAGFIETVLADRVTISVESSPAWETYYRWSSGIIDSFYAAMRAVREAFEVDWRDISTTESTYSYEKLSYTYISKKPLWTLFTPIEEVERYGERYTKRQTDIVVRFSLEIPQPPEGYVGQNCYVVEEESTVTTTKKVRKMRCE